MRTISAWAMVALGFLLDCSDAIYIVGNLTDRHDGGRSSMVEPDASTRRAWSPEEVTEPSAGGCTPKPLRAKQLVLFNHDVDASGDRDFVCALTEEGGVRCWGWLGPVLGDGTTAPLSDAGRDTMPGRPQPLEMDVLDDVASISAANILICAVTNSGGVRCWGDNQWQEDRRAVFGIESTVPEEVCTACTDQDFANLRSSVGWGCQCPSMPEGTLDSCWPSYPHVRSDAANTSNVGGHWLVTEDGGLRHAPSYSTDHMEVDAEDLLTHVRCVTPGTQHWCVLTEEGGIRCWGDNTYGQLGDGTTTSRQNPPVSDVLTGARAVAAGATSTCAIMKEGTVRCWGDNTYGQLGDGTFVSRTAPPATDIVYPCPTTLSNDNGP